MKCEQDIVRALNGQAVPCSAGEAAGDGRKLIRVTVDHETGVFSVPAHTDPGAVSEFLAVWLRRMVTVS